MIHKGTQGIIRSMKYSAELFVKEFAKALERDSAAVFVGAGLSQGAGYPGWESFVHDLVDRLDLPSSSDLLTLAQFAVNRDLSRTLVNQRIVEEFTRPRPHTEVHRQLARLPLKTYWTTNYDSLLESALREVKGEPEVKRAQADLARHIPDRVATVFKMHGDAETPQEAVLIRDDYEDYARTRELFVDVFTADLLMKTFVFVGVSFNDPNLMFLLGRLRSIFKSVGKQHFWVVKRPDDGAPEAQVFDLRVEDLGRYGIRTIVIQKHDELAPLIEQAHKEYARRRRQNAVFFSGSVWDSDERAQEVRDFAQRVAERMIDKGRTIITGLGRGIGTWITAAALETLYKKSEFAIRSDKVVARPFPAGSGEEAAMRAIHRKRMISEARFAVFMCGNANSRSGTRQEFAIAREVGAYVLPVGATGGVSTELWRWTSGDLDAVFGRHRSSIERLFLTLNDSSVPLRTHVDTLDEIIGRLHD